MVAAPPASLPSPKRATLRSGKRLVRFFDPVRGPWSEKRRWGPLGDQRFDHHPPPLALHDPEAVWYSAGSLRGAVAEAFGRPPGVLDRHSGRRIALVEVRAPITVVDLVGNGPRYLGLDQEIGSTTADIASCQAWARAFYAQLPRYAGIRWRGRQLGSENIVLTDRAAPARLRIIIDRDISDATVWPRIAAAARHCRIQVI